MREALIDKKMHKVTKLMKVADKDIEHGKSKTALQVLKKAEKKNETLVKIDKNVRDPQIEKYKKMKQRGC